MHVNISGDVPQFQGNIIFAERCQVELGAWWERHTNIGFIVQRTYGKWKFQYPGNVKVKIARVAARNAERRQSMLEQHCAAISHTLEQQYVRMHCEQSFHRAPLWWRLRVTGA